MPRETFSTLIQTATDLVTDPTTTSTNSGISDSQTFIKKQINRTVQEIQSRLPGRMTQRVQTALTVANQQYYYLPPDCRTIDAMTVTIAAKKWPLQSMEIDRWLEVNRINFSGTAIPTYFFQREKDFGIWPIPQAADNTITLWYQRVYRDLSNLDYTTGTVTVTANSASVTGSITVWTSAMIGRYFQTTNDGNWYRIATVPSATSLTLESVFEGSTASGEAYTIGESPEVPAEMHEYIPYRVAAAYYGGPRRDAEMAEKMLRYYYNGSYATPPVDPQAATSGVNYWINWYNGKGRSDTGVTDKSTLQTIFFNDAWTTVTAP